MDNTETDMEFCTLDIDQVADVSGGGLFGLHAPKWFDNTVHKVGSAVKTGVKTVVNPKAIEHGMIWGAAGAAGGSETGPGSLVTGTAGFLAGYLDSQLSQHGG
ncbi:MAG TPA: hypothetical protein VHW23_44955 [Kofleriaceae bacterium]|jgi:hypothetical protein|nr:hypothetical protein [Kofleriaceae bacterium]